MAKMTTIKLTLRGANANPASLGWPGIRDFIEAYTRALKGMRNGPEPSEVVPTRIDSGSVCIQAEIPAAKYPAAERLRKGPGRSWSTGERQAAEELYRVLRKSNATLTMHRRTNPKVFQVPPAQSFEVTQLEVIEGTLRQLGGAEPRLHIESNLQGLVSIKASREQVRGLSEHMYSVVRVEVRSRRDFESDKLQHCEFLRILPAPRPAERDISEARKHLPVVSSRELIKEHRGY